MRIYLVLVNGKVARSYETLESAINAICTATKLNKTELSQYEIKIFEDRFYSIPFKDYMITTNYEIKSVEVVL